MQASSYDQKAEPKPGLIHASVLQAASIIDPAGVQDSGRCLAHQR